MTGTMALWQEGGKRTDWDNVERPANSPLITIITSTFNAAGDLSWTIKSIREQTYPYIQWIVADGASTDGTIDMLKQNEDLIDVWFSEPDSGIYDAWNKAIGLAKGTWIQFIGAGDELAAPDTISSIAPMLSGAHPKYDLVYGKLYYISERERDFLEETGEPWEVMSKKWQLFLPMTPTHPSVFSHISLFAGELSFDSNYKIAADQLFLLKSIQKKDPKFVDLLIDKMPIGGMSGGITSVFSMSREFKEIGRVLKLRGSILYRAKEESKLWIKKIIINMLPEFAVVRIADIYRRISGKPPRWVRE